MSQLWLRYRVWFKLLPVLVSGLVFLLLQSAEGAVGAFAVLIGLSVLTDRIDRACGVVPDGAPHGGARLRSAAQWAPVGPEPRGDTALSEHEIGMGGPVAISWMLSDGAVVDGTAAGYAAPDAAGLRVGLVLVEHAAERVAIYSPAQKRMAVLEADAGPADVLYRRLHGDAVQTRACFEAAGHVIAFQPFRGLWLPENHAATRHPPSSMLRLETPRGHRLAAHLLLPNDLRLTPHPLRLAGAPPYALTLDGAESQRHVLALDEVFESPGGQCVVVRGYRLNEAMVPDEGLWHAWHAGRWFSLRAHVEAAIRPAVGGSITPYFTRPLSVTDDGHILFEAHQSTWTADGETREPVRSGRVALPVDWQNPPLMLAVANGVLTVALPRR